MCPDQVVKLQHEQPARNNVVVVGDDGPRGVWKDPGDNDWWFGVTKGEGPDGGHNDNVKRANAELERRREAGIPTPHTLTLEQVLEEIGKPYVKIEADWQATIDFTKDPATISVDPNLTVTYTGEQMVQVNLDEPYNDRPIVSSMGAEDEPGYDDGPIGRPFHD
jgi:hypothetical protein